jgi:hypothetical protein
MSSVNLLVGLDRRTFLDRVQGLDQRRVDLVLRDLEGLDRVLIVYMHGRASIPKKNAAAVALSRLGAAKGGKARAAALSPRKRKMIARKAAEARWGKRK